MIDQVDRSDQVVEKRQPETLNEFLGLQARWLDQEAEVMQKRIQVLAGDSPTEEDEQIARKEVESEWDSQFLADKHRWRELKDSGLITVVPPKTLFYDKPWLMLAIDSPSEEVYTIFSRAAGEVATGVAESTPQQVGHGNKTGFAAVELWQSSDKPQPSPFQLIQQTFAKMQEIADPVKAAQKDNTNL